MRLKQIIVIALLMTLSQEGFTQTNKRNDCFILSNKDTVKCSELEFST